MSKIIDIPALLKEISIESPVGENLRESITSHDLYYDIKDARYKARTFERQTQQGYEATDPSPFWRKVFEDSQVILSTLSKDLEISIWLLEALTRFHGFSGLKDGLTLISCLIEKYWEDLFPLLEDEGISNKIALLTSLNGEDREGTLIAPIQNIALTEGKSKGPYTFWHYVKVCSLEAIKDETKKAKHLQNDGISLTDFKTAVSETSPEFFQELGENAAQALETFYEFIKILEEKCGKQAPQTSRIKRALEECLAVIKEISPPLLSTSNVTPSESVEESQEMPILYSDRDKALESLLKVADFFRQREPQSFLPFILERTVQWARKPLSQLLNDLIQEESDKMRIFDLTGIKVEK